MNYHSDNYVTSWEDIGLESDITAYLLSLGHIAWARPIIDFIRDIPIDHHVDDDGYCSCPETRTSSSISVTRPKPFAWL